MLTVENEAILLGMWDCAAIIIELRKKRKNFMSSSPAYAIYSSRFS